MSYNSVPMFSLLLHFDILCYREALKSSTIANTMQTEFLWFCLFHNFKMYSLKEAFRIHAKFNLGLFQQYTLSIPNYWSFRHL
jgi:hypothetical protein